MRTNSTASVGALHPVLFMLLVYVISFVMAFFVCRMVYISVNGSAEALRHQTQPAETSTALK